MNAFTRRLAVMRGAARIQRIWRALSDGRGYYSPRKSTTRGREYKR